MNGTETGGALDPRRKQLLYRANHRGIKEMDILLGGFASARIGELSDEQLDRLEALMDETDRDLLSWFTGEIAAPERVRGEMFDAILKHQSKQVL